VYAVDINHRKDNHLDGTTLLQLKKPSLLILDAHRARSPPPSRTVGRQVLDSIIGTLRAPQGGGNVLLPVDTAGRCLDLILLLEKEWVAHKSVVWVLRLLQRFFLLLTHSPAPFCRFSYPVVLLNSNSSCTVDFAARLIKYMSKSITKQFDTHRQNPFELSFVKTCQHIDELDDFPDPKVRPFGWFHCAPTIYVPVTRVCLAPIDCLFRLSCLPSRTSTSGLESSCSCAGQGENKIWCSSQNDHRPAALRSRC